MICWYNCPFNPWALERSFGGEFGERRLRIRSPAKSGSFFRSTWQTFQQRPGQSEKVLQPESGRLPFPPNRWRPLWLCTYDTALHAAQLPFSPCLSNSPNARSPTIGTYKLDETFVLMVDLPSWQVQRRVLGHLKNQMVLGSSIGSYLTLRLTNFWGECARMCHPFWLEEGQETTTWHLEAHKLRCSPLFLSIWSYEPSIPNTTKDCLRPWSLDHSRPSASKWELPAGIALSITKQLSLAPTVFTRDHDLNLGRSWIELIPEVDS